MTVWLPVPVFIGLYVCSYSYNPTQDDYRHKHTDRYNTHHLVTPHLKQVISITYFK